MIAFLGLCLSVTAAVAGEQDAALTAQEQFGVLSGQVMLTGRPMPDAIISLFSLLGGPPPDRGSVRRVPEGLVRADRLGRFKVKLAPGRYYLGAVSRADAKRMGPPGEDEAFFFSRDEKGQIRQFEVIAGETTDVGVLSGTAPESFPNIDHYFTVEGTMYDEAGRPFPGALILVRENLAIPRPSFISERTGLDGRYSLKLPAGGAFYLVARENLINVGRPAPGNFVGTYGGSAPRSGQVPSIFSGGKSVTGAENSVLTGIDIIMYEIPDPETLKEKFRSQETSSTPPGTELRRPPMP